jgi:hypothetical protein
LKNTIADNKRFTKLLIAKLPNWRYFFEILAKLGLSFCHPAHHVSKFLHGTKKTRPADRTRFSLWWETYLARG